MQTEAAMLGDVKRNEDVPLNVIMKFQTAREACLVCLQWSKIKREYVADRMGISPSHFSQILEGKNKHPPFWFEESLQDICGNNAVVKWRAWNRGYRIVEDDREEQIAEYQRRIEILKGEAA